MVVELGQLALTFDMQVALSVDFLDTFDMVKILSARLEAWKLGDGLIHREGRATLAEFQVVSGFKILTVFSLSLG